MVGEITQWIMESMRGHGQLAVFVGVMIEQIIIPIPSPLIVMGAGALLILPTLPIPAALLEILWIIVLPGAIGETSGSFIGYTVSYYGGRTLVTRFRRFLDVDWDSIANLERRFKGRKEIVSLFLFRAIPVFPMSLVSVFAGLLRISIKPFTVFTFCGAVFRCFFLGFVGWWIGTTYEKFATRLDSVETIVSMAMLIGMFGVLGYLYLRFRRPSGGKADLARY